MSATITKPRDSWRAHPDYSRAVLEDLYRYRRKEPALAWLLWFFMGVMGAHRLYLERPGTGLLMLFTGGGFGVWWIVDAFLLPRMLETYNAEQARRQAEGLPPIAVSFMPPRGEGKVSTPPAWAQNRGGRARLAGDVIVLLVAGVLLGATTAGSGDLEAIAAILALIAIINLGARWESLAEMPLLRSLDRWSHRLRLFYHVNDPGGPLSLLFRPVVGSFSAFFDDRARAEARLYLQLGAAFAVAFTMIDVAGAFAASGGGVTDSINAFIRDMAATFVKVYAFASPIGATLTTHLLLARTDGVLWGLSAVTVAALLIGLLG